MVKKAPVNKRTRAKLLVILVPLFLLGLLFAYIFISSGLKYGWSDNAQDANKPIEEILVADDFKKECSYGSAGRGFDNLTPWRTVLYTYQGDKEEALGKVMAAVAARGFVLKSHGQAIADGDVQRPESGNEPAENEYIDIARPASPYKGYDNGPMELTVVLTDSGNVPVSGLCEDTEVKSIEASASNIVVETKLRLPEHEE